ncbi:hypothetical protein Clacol_005365 [Clathrus columnatus]|uniref:PH domain-containing protein n=1 Tax=Clathrus columnatus TaxID=1419009 RepID=A0AAV5AD71_9AGAM|nr:hypothetical protein Clacol_005365 [Clathrus columnatus]
MACVDQEKMVLKIHMGRTDQSTSVEADLADLTSPRLSRVRPWLNFPPKIHIKPTLMLKQFKSIFTRSSTLHPQHNASTFTTDNLQMISNSQTGGKLLLRDALTIRKGLKEVAREVYLFEKGIICLTMKEKNNLHKSKTSLSMHSRLKGCILIRSMKRIEDTSTADELSLTIDVDSKKVDELTLIFKDQRNLERWHTMLSWLLRANDPPPAFESLIS